MEESKADATGARHDNFMAPDQLSERSGTIEKKRMQQIATEDDLCKALGIDMRDHLTPGVEMDTREVEYVVVPNPTADAVDLSDLRGIKAPSDAAEREDFLGEESSDPDLEALAEIVPKLKTKRNTTGHAMTIDIPMEPDMEKRKVASHLASPTMACVAEETPIEVEADLQIMMNDEENEKKEQLANAKNKAAAKMNESMVAMAGDCTGRVDTNDAPEEFLLLADSMKVQESADEIENDETSEDDNEPSVDRRVAPRVVKEAEAIDFQAINNDESGNEEQNLGGFDDSDSDPGWTASDSGVPVPGLSEAYHHGQISSVASFSTATQTQTHEVNTPMYLPTFKPATGCTNASDFIVRCFVARLRSGVTVVKHGRSRWCKSRLRILHIHPDGRSLSWKSAAGEPASSKRPPKLDLSTCTEVRHAWSPDPLNPMFTGTAILRQKCEAANAHKSFALIFPKRSVDVTAVTADQCKVLMEGFSALCFRLQVANLAGRGGKKGKISIGEEEVASTTASNTLTNNSATLSPSGSGLATRTNQKKHPIPTYSS